MNVLDENFPDDQRRLILSKRIHVQKIGRGIGRFGMKDDTILPLLHELDRPTFFTFDADFYNRRFCHQGYCLVQLELDDTEGAEYVRRVLRHPKLNTKAKRMGLVIQVEPTGLTAWRLHAKKQLYLEWE
jgi:hypothetical protein